MAMKHQYSAGICLAALLAGGCTRNLSTSADLTRTAPEQAMAGMPYNLPMLQFDIETTRTLVSCGKTVAATKAKTAHFDDQPQFSINLTAKPRYVRGETYVVDYRSLASPLKTSDFTLLTYETSGNLKSINVSATDHTGDVIKDVAKIGLSIAALAGGGAPAAIAGGAAGANFDGTPRAAPGAANAKTTIVCTMAAKASVAALVKATTAVGEATEALEQASRSVEELSLLVTVRGLSGQAKGGYTARLAQALREQANAVNALKAATATKGEAAKPLTVITRYAWPERIGGNDELLDADRAVDDFSKLLTLARREPRTVPDGTPADCKPTAGAPGPDIAACLRESLTLHAYLLTTERVGQKTVVGTKSADGKRIDYGPCGSTAFPALDCRTLIDAPYHDPADMRALAKADVVKAREPGVKPGVFVRQPVAGRLFICKGTTACNVDTPDDNLFTEDAADKPLIAPQLGQLRYLPFRNRAFQSNELIIELAEDGSITQFAYRDKVARGAVLAAASADVLQQIQAHKAAMREERAAAQAQSVADLQAQIDTLTKTAELAKLRAPADPAKAAITQQTADTQAEVALLNAQLAKAQARQALLAAGQAAD